ncbi:MAG: methyltransferase domain-containing protein [Chloroflexi bacterium]|nr:methyltransferase domain-containing protein [Chloroflexota bacterium]
MSQPNFFDSGSPYLQHPLLTDERTTTEIDFILSRLALSAGARILDVGCGFGRHSVELARRGFAVTGADPSAAMIAAARERARETAVSITFQQIPAEQYVAAKPFDAAICLFTTLGQITDKEDNRSFLTAVYDALKPGGSLVVEVPQRETAVAQLKPSEKFGDGERYTAVAKQYDSSTKIVNEEFLVVAPEQSRTYLLRYRLFSFSELSSLMADAGFAITVAFGDYAGTSLTEDSPSMLLIGRK